jgi:nitrate reductase delta subunit
LPQPTARQLEEARRLAEEGPPAELVGLEPFGASELAEVGA